MLYFFVGGEPGRSKSTLNLAVLLMTTKAGLIVSTVCPTGTLVYAFKSRLPDVEGIDDIQCDTTLCVLK